MPSADVLDIILRLQNLAPVRAGLKEVASGVREVGAAGTSSSRNLAGMQRNAKALNATLKVLKIAAVGVAGALALAAVDGTKMAVRYDAAIERLHTQAGVSQKLIPGLNKQLLVMAQSGRYAQGPQELADGLYHLVSVGMRAPQALRALEVAAQGAAVGNANLEDTTTALASAWLTGIKGAGDFRHVMALVNATVGAGNMRMEDLVLSLGTGVLPAAKAAGLGITDVFSALAILSDEGWRGSSAMAQFATALHFLTNPTQKAQKTLDALGLSSTDLAKTIRERGLHAGLQELHDRLNAFSRDPVIQQQMLGNILPGGRGRVIMVLLNQLDRLEMKQNQITRTTRQFGEDVARTHQTSSFKIHAAWAVIQADLIRFGHVLEPLAVVVVSFFAKMLTWLLKIPAHIAAVVHWWNQLPAPLQDAGTFLGVLLGLMGTYFLVSKGIAGVTILWSMLTSAVETAQPAMLMLLDNPLLLFLAIAAAGLVTLYIKWKPFRKIVRDIYEVGKEFLGFLDGTLGRLGPVGTAVKIFFAAWLAWKAVGFLSMIRGLIGARAAMTAAAATAGTEAGAVTAATAAEEASATIEGSFAARSAVFARVGGFLGTAIGAAAGPVLVGLLLAAAEQAYAHLLGGGIDALGSPADTQVAELTDPGLQRAERHLRAVNSPRRLANRRTFMRNHPGLTRMNNEYVALSVKSYGHWDNNGHFHESAAERARQKHDVHRMALLKQRLHAGHFPGFAYGGTNWMGGWSLVGEREPEIVNLPPGARVTPVSRLGSELRPVPLKAGVTGETAAPSEGGTYILQVHLDKRVLAEATFDHTQGKAARR